MLRDRHERIVLGAMSGTSADGVDIAAVRVAGVGLAMRARLLAIVSQRFREPLREAIVRTRSAGRCSLRDLAGMGRDITLVYAKATRRTMHQLGLESGDIAGIAAHGQTLFHSPPLTIQWFDPSLLSVETGCTVISDFRRADCALGGQGAPLVPFADYLLFRDDTINRVLLNIGGIANITYLRAGGSLGDVIAFDTGPGNCLSDAIARRHLQRGYDAGGRVAGRGTPCGRVADAFMAYPYFAKAYPKSTDGPEMIRAFGRLRGAGRLSVEDQLATACLCCARSVAEAIARLGRVDEVVVGGGGARNATLMRMLRQQTQLPVRTTADLGIPIEAREATAFALLGAATLDHQASNVPGVTGAKIPAVLGSITSAAVRREQ